MSTARRLLAPFTGPALLAALAAAACTGGEPAETPDAGDVHVYEVRGQVTALPDPDDPLADMRVRHEPIPHFVSIDGEAVGMDSMNMPFPLADGVDLGALAVGDKVLLTFEVDWDGEVPYRATRVERLADDVALDFSKPADEHQTHDPTPAQPE